MQRHNIHQADGAFFGFELGLEDKGIGTIAAMNAVIMGGWRYDPTSVAFVSEHGRKAGMRVEARQAQPVDAAIAPDQCRRMCVADQCVIFQSRHPTSVRSAHSDALRSLLVASRPCVKAENPARMWSRQREAQERAGTYTTSLTLSFATVLMICQRSFCPLARALANSKA
jgi:hypothetical protein